MQKQLESDVAALLDRLAAEALPAGRGFAAWLAFLRAHAALMRRLATDLVQETGLTLGDFDVLAQLVDAGGELRMTDLAAQTGLSTSGVTRVVDRMDRDGLVRREACASDRRSSYAVVTDAGMARLEEVLPGHLKLMQRWFIGQLPAGELDQMLASLRTIRDAVNPCATAGSAESDSVIAAG